MAMLIYRKYAESNNLEFRGVHDNFWTVFRIGGENWVYRMSFEDEAQTVRWMAYGKPGHGKALAYANKRKQAEMKVTDKWPGPNPGKEILIWREGTEMEEFRGEKPEEQQERKELKEQEDEAVNMEQQELFKQ